MNIVWQDSVGSFLDPSNIDAASSSALFPTGAGSALWSSAPIGSSFAPGDAPLWDDTTGTLSGGDTTVTGADGRSAGWQQQFGDSSGSLDVAWTGASGNRLGLTWQSNDAPAQSSLAAVPTMGGMDWASTLSTPAILLWAGAEPALGGALLLPGSILAGGNSPPLPGILFSLDLTLPPNLSGAPQTPTGNDPQPLLGSPVQGAPTVLSALGDLSPSQLVWTFAPAVPSGGLSPTWETSLGAGGLPQLATPSSSSGLLGFSHS
jgi:hypothetical protein